MSKSRKRYMFIREAVREGKFFLAAAVIISLITALAAYAVLDRKYTSVGVVLLSGDGLDNRSIMAAGSELGMYLAGDYDPGVDITLYPRILESRRIGKDVLRRDYTFSENGKEVSRKLIDHLNLENIDAALIALDGITDFWINEESNTLAIKARTDNPELSAAVVNEYVDRLERFNRIERRSVAREGLVFIEGRLEENREELRRAEESLKKFRSRNRNYATATDPGLLMRHRRLVREVELRQAIYEELNKQQEKAAIEVEKDTPILSVLDSGFVPSSYSSPSIGRLLLAFGILGILGGIIIAACRKAYIEWRSGPESRSIDIIFDNLFLELQSIFRFLPWRRSAGRVEN